MNITFCEDPQDVGRKAAAEGAAIIRECLVQKPEVNIVLATGSSQMATLSHLVKESLEWGRVHVFHLDEYIGLGGDHPASFSKYIRDRFAEQVMPLKSVHYICGDAPNPEEEIRRLCDLMAVSAIDIAFIGIGENGHIAFNDPPADFETEEAYIRVQLDEVCRRQQLDEGWFSQLDEVPRHAITMSVQQIMKSRHIICSVPGSRKAAAVQAALEGPPDPRWPASILNRHPHCSLFLDSESASLLSEHARVRQGL